MERTTLTDRDIADAIIGRDTDVTRWFLYERCYPLFASIHSKYFTDCATPAELINEIYLYILMPHRETGRSKLQDFGFRCSLPTWLKVVTENYCHQLFSRQKSSDENISIESDRIHIPSDSISLNNDSLDSADLTNILAMMPNKRYRQLIQLRYVDERSNEETAEIMGLSMANYYNCHKRAKAQYCEILKKEGLL